MTGGSEQFEQFMLDSNNTRFRRSAMTWFSLVILLVLYPAMSLAGIGEDPSAMLRNMNQGILLFMLIVTVLVQWTIFMFNYAAVYLEGTGLPGIGLKKIRMVDFAWATAFLLAANLLLAGVAWVLAQIGLPMPGEIGNLVPTTLAGKVVWVGVSFTAGFCEEVAFRGYLMTRLRILLKGNNWLVPTIISAVAFGACHAYQGWPGFIVITIYGALFSLLYIRTGSLWPCIIAHFFQDFGALIFPH